MRLSDAAAELPGAATAALVLSWAEAAPADRDGRSVLVEARAALHGGAAGLAELSLQRDAIWVHRDEPDELFRQPWWHATTWVQGHLEGGESWQRDGTRSVIWCGTTAGLSAHTMWAELLGAYLGAPPGGQVIEVVCGLADGWDGGLDRLVAAAEAICATRRPTAGS